MSDMNFKRLGAQLRWACRNDDVTITTDPTYVVKVIITRANLLQAESDMTRIMNKVITTAFYKGVRLAVTIAPRCTQRESTNFNNSVTFAAELVMAEPTYCVPLTVAEAELLLQLSDGIMFPNGADLKPAISVVGRLEAVLERKHNLNSIH